MGAPIWQHYNGNTVLIAIHSKPSANITKSSNGCAYETDYSLGERVSQHIDWILDIINKNKQ